MTINLSFVKQNEPTFRQISCHETLNLMTDTPKPYADIAERLIWLRSLEGMTQKEYAAAIGVKRPALNNWESGAYRLSLDGALAIQARFGVSLDFMYCGNDAALDMTIRKAWRSRPRESTSRNDIVKPDSSDA